MLVPPRELVSPDLLLDLWIFPFQRRTNLLRNAACPPPAAHPGRIAQKRRRRAEPFHWTGQTLRPLRGADFAPEVDQPQREGVPLLAGDNAHQLLLDLLSIIGSRQSHPLAHAPHVSVDDNAQPIGAILAAAPWLQPCCGWGEVGGLASDALQREQLLHGQRHTPGESLDQRTTHIDDRPRLLPEEPGGFDDLFHIPRARGG